MSSAELAHWLISLPNSDHHFWSGIDELTFDGETYIGAGHVISLGVAEASTGTQDKRLTAQISAADLDLRAALLQDPGPVPVEVSWIYSNNSGRTWTRVPRSVKGRLSKPQIKDGIYTIEMETYSGDIDRGRQINWSHEEQLRRHPGDLCFQDIRSLSLGIDTRWPP